MTKNQISTAGAPQAIGPYSQAVVHQGTVYISGQIPLIPETMLLVSDDITEQIDQVFSNLQEICQAAGGDLDSIVKLTVYLINLDHFTAVNTAMENLLNKPYPARAAVEVSALPKGAMVEVDAIMSL
ncbi:MAG: reactive intermediate/imine deaminase [Gammaproteobacteria bacterium]|jgi:reactive intermediate/imine deaminase|nr:reactive intermediate/imine deaminase [Gammaproteobacteria bacterium]|tara:strand:- start:308 stop:688 length:381 start_codon:yes stop_codon:yes gene_type:complete